MSFGSDTDPSSNIARNTGRAQQPCNSTEGAGTADSMPHASELEGHYDSAIGSTGAHGTLFTDTDDTAFTPDIMSATTPTVAEGRVRSTQESAADDMMMGMDYVSRDERSHETEALLTDPAYVDQIVRELEDQFLRSFEGDVSVSISEIQNMIENFSVPLDFENALRGLRKKMISSMAANLSDVSSIVVDSDVDRLIVLRARCLAYSSAVGIYFQRYSTSEVSEITDLPEELKTTVDDLVASIGAHSHASLNASICKNYIPGLITLKKREIPLSILRYYLAQLSIALTLSSVDVVVDNVPAFKAAIWNAIFDMDDPSVRDLHDCILADSSNAVTFAIRHAAVSFDIAAMDFFFRGVPHTFETILLRLKLLSMKCTAEQSISMVLLKTAYDLLERRQHLFLQDYILLRKHGADVADLLPLHLNQASEGKPQDAESQDAWLARFVMQLSKSSIELPVTFQNNYKDPHDIVGALSTYCKVAAVLFKDTCNVNSGFAYPMISIVQSSGWGKTRLVLELGNVMPAMYFCLRQSSLSTGSPAASPLVFKHLINDFKPFQFHKFLLKCMLLRCAIVRLNTRKLPRNDINRNIMRLLFNTTADPQPMSELCVPVECVDGGLVSCSSICHFLTNREFTRDEIAQLLNIGLHANSTVANSVHAALSAKSDSEDAPNSPIPAQFSVASDALAKETASLCGCDACMEYVNAQTPVQVTLSNGRTLTYPRLPCSPLVVAFDEALSLITGDRQVTSSSAHDARQSNPERLASLRKALATFNGHIVGVCLDTNAKLSNFAPSFFADPSARIASGLRVLFHPFYHLALIQSNTIPEFAQPYRALSISQDRLYIKSCSVDSKDYRTHQQAVYNPFELVPLSRPLFEGLLPTCKVNDLAIADKLWKKLSFFAGYKLCPQVGDLKDLTASASLAMFAARFSIVIEDRIMGQHLVAGAMATLLHVNEERSMAIVRYVPEPMLALGAVRWMNMDRFFSAGLRFVVNLTQHGLISSPGRIGDFGEFTAAILVGRAFDHAHRQPLDLQSGAQDSSVVSANATDSNIPPAELLSSPGMLDSQGPPPLYVFSDAGAPVTVQDFFASLFNESHWDTLIHALRRGNGHSSLGDLSALEQMMYRGWTWPLQFVHLPKNITANNGYLQMAWDRRIAIMTLHNQKGCDMIIPVMVPCHDKGDGMRLTAIFVEVKCTRKLISQNRVTMFQQSLHEEARILVPNGPIICLTLQLGIGGISIGGNDKLEAAPAARLPSPRVVAWRNISRSTPEAVEHAGTKRHRSSEERFATSDQHKNTTQCAGEAIAHDVDEALMISAHTLDAQTFGDCVTGGDLQCLRDIVARHGIEAHDLTTALPLCGFTDKQAEMHVSLRSAYFHKFGIEPAPNSADWEKVPVEDVIINFKASRIERAPMSPANTCDR